MADEGSLATGLNEEKRPAHTAQCAYPFFQIATRELEDAKRSERSRSSSAGREDRARRPSSDPRSEIANAAAVARWR